VKLVLFQTTPGSEMTPGVLTGRGIVDNLGGGEEKLHAAN